MPRTLEEEIMNLCAMRGRVEVRDGIVKVYDLQGRPNVHVTFTVPLGERLIPPKNTRRANYAEIIHRFDLAAIKLKYPSMHFVDAQGRHFRMYRTSDKSRFPGAASIEWKLPGNETNNEWCGRVFRDGRLQFASGASNEVRQSLQDLLTAFCDSPLSAAKFYARETNRCMFCAHPLEEPSSVECGYGPICAETYGLPHGQNGTARRVNASEIEHEVSDLFSSHE